MEFYSKTDIGKKRDSNQDAVVGKVISDTLAWSAVCDGMGGAKGGDIASNLAIEKITLKMNGLNENMSKKEILDLMNDAIQDANSSIFEKSLADETLHGMGTTVVLAVVLKDFLYVMHVGDSRAYLIRKGEIFQIGFDHSVVQEMINSGEITSTEARSHHQKNIITRALGINDSVQIDSNDLELSLGDMILICTDGLSNDLEDSEICQIAEGKNPEEIVKMLIDECNSRGGKDNITVSLIKI